MRLPNTRVANLCVDVLPGSQPCWLFLTSPTFSSRCNCVFVGVQDRDPGSDTAGDRQGGENTRTVSPLTSHRYGRELSLSNYC